MISEAEGLDVLLTLLENAIADHGYLCGGGRA